MDNQFTKEELELIHNALATEIAEGSGATPEIRSLQGKVVRLIEEIDEKD